jgi:hypothetical protein
MTEIRAADLEKLKKMEANGWTEKKLEKDNHA